MSLPTAAQVRVHWEGYGLDAIDYYAKVGTWVAASPTVTSIDTNNLAPGMPVSGTGIPSGAKILTVDTLALNGQITLDAQATQSQTGGNLSIAYYPCGVSDYWLTQRMTNGIVPWLERITGMSFSAIATADEVYDGTGGAILALRRRPIVDLLSINYTNVDTNFYFIAPTALVIIKDEGVLKAKANFNESSYIPIFFRGERNIRVKYTYGFATMPDDITEAVAMLTAEKALGHMADMTGGGSVSMQGYSRSFGKRGRWHEKRQELARMGMALVSKYITRGA